MPFQISYVLFSFSLKRGGPGLPKLCKLHERSFSAIKQRGEMAIVKNLRIRQRLDYGMSRRRCPSQTCCSLQSIHIPFTISTRLFSGMDHNHWVKLSTRYPHVVLTSSSHISSNLSTLADRIFTKIERRERAAHRKTVVSAKRSADIQIFRLQKNFLSQTQTPDKTPHRCLQRYI